MHLCSVLTCVAGQDTRDLGHGGRRTHGYFLWVFFLTEGARWEVGGESFGSCATP